jgi:hypothetical protein
VIASNKGPLIPERGHKDILPAGTFTKIAGKPSTGEIGQEKIRAGKEAGKGKASP